MEYIYNKFIFRGDFIEDPAALTRLVPLEITEDRQYDEYIMTLLMVYARIDYSMCVFLVLRACYTKFTFRDYT